MNDMEIAKLISFAAARANEEGVEVRVEISQPGTDQERVDIFAAPHKDARASVKVTPAYNGPYYDTAMGVAMNAVAKDVPDRIYMLGEEVFVKGTLVEIIQSIEHEDSNRYSVKIVDAGNYGGHWVVGVDRSALRSDF